MDKFLIIDGNSLINRAFYGLPPLKSLSGKPCNAIYGFINSMLSQILNEKPDYLVCVFDAGKHTFRHEMFAEYKGTRDKMPEDLHQQLLDLKELLKTMNICVKEIPEIEADDIIGSITRQFKGEFLLLSGDKDLLQLINENTTVMLTQSGMTNVKKVDEELLLKEFNLKPYQVVELKAIMGDSSDNIPGVAGIGKVGANKLLAEYDNLDNIYANIDKITGSTKTKLIENKEMAYLSKKLATIKLDVDLGLKLEEMKLKMPFNNNARKAIQELDFKSILNKQGIFEDANDSVQEEIEEIEQQYEIVEIDSEKTLNELLKSIKNSVSIFTDEMSIHLGVDNKEYILYTSGEIFNANTHKISEILKSEVEKVCFDAKNLMHEMDNYGFEINNHFDVSIAMYIANEMDAEISIEDALKLNNIKTEAKAVSLYKLKNIYINKLVESLQLKLFSEIEQPLVDVLYNMEVQGFKVDVSQIDELSKVYHNELDELTNKICSLAGENFNVKSPKQLQEILFDKLKIEYKGKKGTSIEVLKAIENKHEIVPLIIRHRKIAKLVSTYLDGMKNYISEDGKIHTTFMQRTTTTGRLSSREPNLQNLPIRDDEGRQLRKMFISSFDNGTIISADYNQIELRLMANFSQDENMVADYLSGKDIHSATASKIFNVPISEVSSLQRRIAKSVNFGIIYGISAYGLSQNIECSPKEAGDFIKKYFEAYPKVMEYGNKCVEQAKVDGYSKTIMGRVRHIADINSANHIMRSFAERVAKNMPLQGGASDIIKLAMIKVYNCIKNENLKSKLILQIHDELVVDCHPGESEIIKNILKSEMENVINLTVPLIVNVNEGISLYEAK